MKNKKSKWDNIKLGELVPRMSYTRFKDGGIVQENSPFYSPPRQKLVYWPNEGYKPKMIRK